MQECHPAWIYPLRHDTCEFPLMRAARDGRSRLTHPGVWLNSVAPSQIPGKVHAMCTPLVRRGTVRATNRPMCWRVLPRNIYLFRTKDGPARTAEQCAKRCDEPSTCRRSCCTRNGMVADISVVQSVDHDGKWGVAFDGQWAVGFYGERARQLAERRRDELAQLIEVTKRFVAETWSCRAHREA
jgi:hypothetical protein